MTEAGPTFDRNRGAAFDDADVAACYRYRPAYPDALYADLLELAPTRAAALDLGCGTGKLAGRLAPHFARIDAVDPSAPMLDVARSAYQDPRIRWQQTTAERATLTPPYDLVCAGASVHWFDHATLMPRLAQAMAPDAWLCVVDGDGAWQPPWQPEWDDFMASWLSRVGRVYAPAAFDEAMTAYRAWLDVAGARAFTAAVAQTVGDFVACQHSRASWARAALGAERCRQFDAELGELLAPYADAGVLRYQVRTTLTWGRPRSVGSELWGQSRVPE